MNQDNQENPDIPLSEMIGALRQELHVAQEQSVDEQILFDIEKVELELNVEVARTAKGEAGIAFHVVNIGGGLERTGTTAQKFTLTLVPVTGDSRDRLVVAAEADEAPLRN